MRRAGEGVFGGNAGWRDEVRAVSPKRFWAAAGEGRGPTLDPLDSKKLRRTCCADARYRVISGIWNIRPEIALRRSLHLGGIISFSSQVPAAVSQ